MENDIAICYMTHNHPQVVQHIVGLVHDMFNQRGIDICVYDDSDTDETKAIVEKFIADGVTNLYYVDAHIVTTGDDKMLHLFQGHGLPKKYKYIWPSKDRSFFCGETLDKMVEACREEKYDVVFMAIEYDRWELDIPELKDEYDNPALFFSHYGQLSTNWEGMVYRYDRMMDGIDWDDMLKRTVLGPDCSFNQPIFLFTRLTEIKEPFVRVIHGNLDDRKNSTLVSSTWGKYLFPLWIEHWMTAISSLPSIYDKYKMDIIRSETRLRVLFGGTDAVLFYHEKGIFTREAFEKYKSYWSMISDYPEEHVNMILDGRRDEIFQIYLKKFYDAFSNKDYDEAYYTYYNNQWFDQAYETSFAKDLNAAFVQYKNLRTSGRSSDLFLEVTSPEELVSKYRKWQCKIIDHKSIAYCVPTYNRPEMLKNMFERNANDLKDSNIDVYIYDSSTNNETELLVKEFMNDGYDNITYIKVPSDTDSGEKVLRIYSGWGQKKDYDYIWLAKDRANWSSDMIFRVMRETKEGPDVVLIRNGETDKTLSSAKSKYNKPVEFYRDWAWLVTSFDTTVINRKSIIDVVNMDVIRENYCFDNYLPFPPIAVIFTALAKKENCNVVTLKMEQREDCINIDPGNDGRKDCIFRVWGHYWHSTNKKLPSIYDEYKAEVIKDTASLSWLIGRETRLLTLWNEGYVTEEKLQVVDDIWNEISYIPKDYIDRIKSGDKNFIVALTLDNIWKMIESSDYQQAIVFYGNMRNVLEENKTKEVVLTEYAMEIYYLEQEQNKDSLFKNGNRKEVVFNKIEMIIYFIKNLENDEDYSDASIKELIKSGDISMAMLAYLMEQEAGNMDLLIKKFEKYMSH